MTIQDFVAQPGFFRLEKGSRAVGYDAHVVCWRAGADPCTGGESTGWCRWGEGATVEAAIADWFVACQEERR